MKYLLVLLILPSFCFSQKNFDKVRDAEAAIKDHKYVTSIGWTIKEGDELILGKGSMPDKSFAFITENANMLQYRQYSDGTTGKLQHTYNGRKVKVSDLIVFGTKKMGFYINAKIKVGQLSRYSVDIENAIESGEVVVPQEYAKKNTTTLPATSKADELKKLKELLDSGALTQEEYDAEKKKILNN